MEDDHQHRRPPERDEERLHHQEDEIDEDCEGDVEEDRRHVLAIGEGH